MPNTDECNQTGEALHAAAAPKRTSETREATAALIWCRVARPTMSTRIERRHTDATGGAGGGGGGNGSGAGGEAGGESGGGGRIRRTAGGAAGG